MGSKHFKSSTVIFLLVVFGSVSSPDAKQQSTPRPTSTPTSTLPKITSHVLLISVSGLGANLLKSERESAPYLHSLTSKGTTAATVESTYPSETVPALATIVTGLLPGDHGVLTTTNAMISEPRGRAFAEANVFKNPPIWVMVEQNKMTATLIGQPFQEKNAIESHESAKKTALSVKTAVQPKKITAVSETIALDQINAQKAIETLESLRPHLLWLHLTHVEISQKTTGIDSQTTKDSLKTIDDIIERLVATTERIGIRQNTTFLIVADHGMAKVEEEFNPNVLLAKKGWLTLDSEGRITDWKAKAQPFGGSAAIYVKNPADEKLIEALFREVHEKPDSPIWRILNRQASSRLGGEANAALYLDAAPGYQMGTATRGKLLIKATEKASSGYLPQRTEMRPAFLAFGRGIKPGYKLEYVRLTDIAPTIARLLGFKMPVTRGKILSGMFSE